MSLSLSPSSIVYNVFFLSYINLNVTTFSDTLLVFVIHLFL